MKTHEKQIEELKAKNIMLREKAKKSANNFKKELKTAVSTAIVAAFGFLIALQWKDLITEFVNQISSKSPVQGTLVTTLIVTIVSVLGIILTTKLLSNKEETPKV